MGSITLICKLPLYWMSQVSQTRKGHGANFCHKYTIDLILQGKFDDILKEIVECLKRKYPFNECMEHPQKCCFQYQVTNKHFDLTNPWLKVWATAIVCLLQYMNLWHSYYCVASEGGHV